MPIEIKELVIRATVDPGTGDEKAAKTGDLQAKEDIVTECVEQVLEILRKKRER